MIFLVFLRSAVFWKRRSGRRGNWLLLRGAPLHYHYRVPLHEVAVSAALPCKPAIRFTSRQCRMHAPGFWHVNIASPSQNTFRLRHTKNVQHLVRRLTCVYIQYCVWNLELLLLWIRKLRYSGMWCLVPTFRSNLPNYTASHPIKPEFLLQVSFLCGCGVRPGNSVAT